MQSINANNYSYNDFDFSMHTSSGDNISLNLFDEKSSSLSYEQDKNTKTTTLSLSHSYGYSFHYDGNGIDKNDKKEIEQALKAIKPMLEKYFENINKSDKNPSNDKILDMAFDIHAKLPTHHNQDAKNYMLDKTLKTMDKILAKPENQSQKILKNTQKLFDIFMEQDRGFELYM